MRMWPGNGLTISKFWVSPIGDWLISVIVSNITTDKDVTDGKLLLMKRKFLICNLLTTDISSVPGEIMSTYSMLTIQ